MLERMCRELGLASGLVAAAVVLRAD